jgi:hypothetical protein
VKASQSRNHDAENGDLFTQMRAASPPARSPRANARKPSSGFHTSPEDFHAPAPHATIPPPEPSPNRPASNRIKTRRETPRQPPPDHVPGWKSKSITSHPRTSDCVGCSNVDPGRGPSIHLRRNLLQILTINDLHEILPMSSSRCGPAFLEQVAYNRVHLLLICQNFPDSLCVPLRRISVAIHVRPLSAQQTSSTARTGATELFEFDGERTQLGSPSSRSARSRSSMGRL